LSKGIEERELAKMKREREALRAKIQAAEAQKERSRELTRGGPKVFQRVQRGRGNRVVMVDSLVLDQA